MSSRDPEGDREKPASEGEPKRARLSSPSHPGLNRAAPVYGAHSTPRWAGKSRQVVLANPPFGEPRRHFTWADIEGEQSEGLFGNAARYLVTGTMVLTARECIPPYGRLGRLPELLRPLRQQEPEILDLRVQQTPDGPKIYIAVEKLDTERDRRIIDFLLQVEKAMGEVYEYSFVSPRTIRVVAADACPIF